MVMHSPKLYQNRPQGGHWQKAAGLQHTASLLLTLSRKFASCTMCSLTSVSLFPKSSNCKTKKLSITKGRDKDNSHKKEQNIFARLQISQKMLTKTATSSLLLLSSSIFQRQQQRQFLPRAFLTLRDSLLTEPLPVWQLTPFLRRIA